MKKRKLLNMADDLEGNLRALLQTPPPPPGTAGSRKAMPKASRGGVRVKGQKAPLRDSEAERQAVNAKLTRARLRKEKAAKKR
jgi:hypothetical protein